MTARGLVSQQTDALSPSPGPRAALSLVTGAASGIGAALCDLLLARGDHVVAVDLSPQPWSSATGRAADAFTAHQCDVSDEDDVAELFEAVDGLGVRLRSVFNCAGTHQRTLVPIHELALDEWERVLAVNARSTFLVMRSALARMTRAGRGGAIVNMSSLGAFRAAPGTSAYVASKAAIVMLTKAAALEYAPHGIRINAICPGAVDTPMARGLGPERLEAARAQIPLGRLGDPAEIAELAYFLASDSAGFMTGTAYIADGGRNAS